MKSNKKAFTIVELVIVIAVIAILAAVLIPTFSNLIKRSKVSADQQLSRNLNTALRADINDHPTMTAALAAAEEFGYNVSKINKSATDNEILWDSKNDVFCYFESDKNGITYIPETTLKVAKETLKDVDYWVISKTPSDKYSTYLYNTELTAIDNLTTGLDVGNETITSISYIGGASAQTVTIVTNGGSLTINAKNDSVIHYGYADTVNIIDVAPASYHEKDTVKFLEVAAGHVVLEATAKVTAFHFTATGVGNAAKFENADGKKISVDLSNVPTENLPSFSRDAVKIDENGTYVAKVKTDKTEFIWLFGKGVKEQMVATTNEGAIAESGTLKAGITAGAEDGSVAEQIANPAKRNSQGQLVDTANNVVSIENAVVEELPSKEDVQIGATLFAGGTGTENDPFLIVDYDTFQHVSLFDWYGVAESYYYDGHSWKDSCFYADENALLEYHGKIPYFKVKPGITEIDCANWKPVYLYGCIEGSNVTLKNLDKVLFQKAYAYDSFINGYIECRIENFNVEANITYSGSASAIVNSAGPVITFKNINISGKIEGNYVGSFMTFGAGQFESDSNYNPTIAGHYMFDSCTSSATLQCNSIGEGGAGGFIHHPYGAAGTTITIKDSKYNGTMYVFSGKAHNYVSTFDATTVVFDYSEGFEPGVYTTKDSNKVNSSNYEYPAPNYVSVSGSKYGQLSNYDVIQIDAVSNASYATATLFIAPNPGALLYPAIQESLVLEDGHFTTMNVRKYDITWNGEVKDVINGNNYEVGGNGGYTGINGSYIIINQYSADGTLLSSDQYTVSGKLGS